LRECETAFNELRRYIEDIIAAARTKRLHGKSDGEGEGYGEAADLFRRLIDANDEEEANARLSNDELASNVFVSADLDNALSATETDLALLRLSSLRDMVCCGSALFLFMTEA